MNNEKDLHRVFPSLVHVKVADPLLRIGDLELPPPSEWRPGSDTQLDVWVCGRVNTLVSITRRYRVLVQIPGEGCHDVTPRWTWWARRRAYRTISRTIAAQRRRMFVAAVNPK